MKRTREEDDMMAADAKRARLEPEAEFWLPTECWALIVGHMAPNDYRSLLRLLLCSTMFRELVEIEIDKRVRANLPHWLEYPVARIPSYTTMFVWALRRFVNLVKVIMRHTQGLTIRMRDTAIIVIHIGDAHTDANAIRFTPEDEMATWIETTTRQYATRGLPDCAHVVDQMGDEYMSMYTSQYEIFEDLITWPRTALPSGKS